MKLKFSITKMLFAVGVVAAFSSIVAKNQRQARQLGAKERQITFLQEVTRTVERGNAVLKLAYSNPGFRDDTKVTDWLNHELACCVIEHWEMRNEVGEILNEEGYVSDFVSRAMFLLGCDDGKAFIDKIQFDIPSFYPEDELRLHVIRYSGETGSQFRDFLSKVMQSIVCSRPPASTEQNGAPQSP